MQDRQTELLPYKHHYCNDCIYRIMDHPLTYEIHQQSKSFVYLSIFLILLYVMRFLSYKIWV